MLLNKKWQVPPLDLKAACTVAYILLWPPCRNREHHCRRRDSPDHCLQGSVPNHRSGSLFSPEVTLYLFI